VRFELTSPCELAVFKTAPFDRSGTPPLELSTGHRASSARSERCRDVVHHGGEGNSERDGCERVAEIVNQICEQRDTARESENRGLRERGREQDHRADRHGPNTIARPDD
jgi:hypothetical protein